MVKHRSFTLTIPLVLYCFSLMTCPGSANMGGYIVEPGPPGMDPGTPLETVKVPVWEYSPQDAAVILALLVSPLLLFPVELFFTLKVYVYLGYRKIAKKNVLDNPSRNAIFSFIRETPGTDFSEISRETGVPQNSLRYHIAILKLTNKVTMLETSRNTRYFENSNLYSAMERKVLKYLHNTPTRTLLQLLMVNPDLTRVQIEIALGISGAGVNWHMHRLSDDGLLVIRKVGRTAQYELNSDIIPYLKKYLPLY